MSQIYLWQIWWCLQKYILSKFEGAPWFSRKIQICRKCNWKETMCGNMSSSWLNNIKTQYVGRDILKKIFPKWFLGLLSLFLLFGFIARFYFPESPSCIFHTLATDPQILIALFSLSPVNSVFLVLMLYLLLCLFNYLWIPSPCFHLDTFTHEVPNLLYDSMLLRRHCHWNVRQLMKQPIALSFFRATCVWDICSIRGGLMGSLAFWV